VALGNPSSLKLGFGHLTVDVPVGLTFSSVPEGEPVALFDSSGWLTLAINVGSAADRYGIEPGASARVTPVD
jgi:S-adenosylmethionine hydrolase